MLPLGPFAAVCSGRAQRRPQRPALLVSSIGALRPLGQRPARRWLPPAVRLLAIAVMIVALARPRAGRVDAAVEAEGIDIMLALDTSRSMLDHLGEGDEPKLEIARDVIDRFIEGREDDRIGITQFQAEALVASPLTLDREALRTLLGQIRNGPLAEGTAIGSGVASAVDALRSSTARSRIVILLTDGENNSGEIQPIQSARIAKALGIRVYTIGLARPLAEGDSELKGVDERTLREISRLTDGRYFAATDLESLDEVYRTIGELETSRVGEREYTAFDEFAPLLLLAAVLLLVGERAAAATFARRAP